VSTLERFTSQAALALRGARLLEQVQHMAATDGLTMIANRRTFEDSLVREIARAGRQRHVSLLMIDIDRFKMLNDVHGHPTGDQVLREVAQIIKEQCREFDTAARYGGEEFAAVLPSCTGDEAARLADQIRMTIAAGTTVPVTVSVGVGTFPGDGRDAESLVRAADQALYEAKHQGRNRVIAACTLDTRSSMVDMLGPTTGDGDSSPA
jgi:diguanylate cyclase (GGDEF)-like protein